MAKFAAAGLDEDLFLSIAENFNRHKVGTGKVNGLYDSQIDKWTKDVQPGQPSIEGRSAQFYGVGKRLGKPSQRSGLPNSTAEALMDILVRQADMAIVTPGKGDLPLMMRTPLGSVIGQFKSFSFTAVNRIMLPNMQRIFHGDPNAAAGMVMQFGLAIGAYGLKMHGMKREDEIDLSWQNMANEMIQRSGYFGIFADANAISHKLTMGNVSVQGLLSALSDDKKYDMSRYYSRSFAGDIIGPTFSTLQDGGRVFASIFDGSYSRGDLSAIRRMLPYQNLYLIRRQIQSAEEEIAERFGL
jgi:hypothetical protein